MKLLLDECLPEELKDFISGHEVSTVSDMGWKGILNGELMTRAANNGFEVLLTVDKNLQHQQNIKKYPLAIVVFSVYRNTVPQLRDKLPELYQLLPSVEKAKVYLC